MRNVLRGQLLTDRQGAFSLPEMTVVVAVLAVLVGIALPAVFAFVEQHQQRVIRDQLTSHVQFTRTQAVISGRTHLLCGSSSGLICDGDWTRHWLVTDLPGNIVRRMDLPKRVNLCWRGFTQKAVSFYRNGTTPASNGRFSLCKAGQVSWQLVLNRQGRLRLAEPGEQRACCEAAQTS